MKTKGITIWEKYAEFIVLGAVLVVMVIYIIGQIASPNVKELAGEQIAPGDWHGKLKDTAESIKRKQGSTTVPPTVEEAIKIGEKNSSVTLDGFRNSLASRIGPTEMTSLPEYQLVPRVTGGNAQIAANSRFVQASLPSASKPLVYQTFDLLSEGVAEEYEQIGAIVGDAPDDISWLTIASEFDVAEAVKKYTSAGEEGELPLPDRWHNNRIDLLDVRIERQQLVDGKWSDPEVVDTLPGQFSFRDRLAKASDIDAEDRDEILGMLVDDTISMQISQPSFYSTENVRWLDPDGYLEEMAVNDIQQDKGVDASTKLRLIKLRKLARLEKERDKLIEKYGEGGSGSGSSGLGSSSGGGGSGTGSRGGAGGAKDAGNDSAAKARARIERLKKQIEELKMDLGIGNFETSDSVDDAESSSVPDSQDTQEDTDSMEWVWGYDVTARPGRTYRYRTTLLVYNPLFARKLSLIDDQKHLAESMVNVIEASEWSDPFTVVPSLQILAVRAMPSGYDGNSGRLGYGEATAEVWRFYEGQWWPRRFSIQPGDVIGGVAVPDGTEPDSVDPIDFSTSWFVVDVLPTIGASKSDSRYGKGAGIIIQNLDDGSRKLIDPVADAGRQRPGDGTF